MLAPCGLPLIDQPLTGQGKCSHLVRTDGSFALAMTAVGTAWLPPGNLPRLLLARVCTEAAGTGRRDLVLGNSLRDFLGRLGIISDGDVPRRWLRDQMERLFGSAVSLHYRGDDKSVRLSGVIADKAVFWWDFDPPQVDSLFPREIRLSHPFSDSIVRQSIPIELNCLHALRRSTLGLHLYLWLTYNIFSLTQPLVLSWRQVYAQHRSFSKKDGDNLTVRTFRKKCLTELTKTSSPGPSSMTPPSEGGSSSIPFPRRYPLSKAGRQRLSVRLIPLLACCASLLLTAGAPAFPNLFPSPSFARAFGCLQPLASA